MNYIYTMNPWTLACLAYALGMATSVLAVRIYVR